MDDEPGPRPAEAKSDTGKLEGKAAAALGDTARGLDDRFGAAKAAKKALRHIFPDHWSFLLGEIALYSFIILLLTGTFLTLFFKPSMSEIVYHGSYLKLDGVKMSEAYSSTLDISFDVRGGLLMRQIHHWAALLFVASIMIHALRLFFTGAFRKPREINWVIGTVMFILAAMEGFCGYSLPDDLLSGTGLRIADGIILSVPVVGTYLSFFLFGGQYPGESVIPRFYIVHVLILPGLLMALIAAHLMIIWHQGHTQWPGKKQTERNEVGNPLYPVFMAKTGALFFFVFGALALLGAIAQINPIWLYGPYSPVSDSSLSQPDFYIGFLEGTLRMMPGIESNLAGHTFIWNVFLPAVVFPAVFFLAMGAYPVIEQWATGDRRGHQLLDRPRNAPGRTGIGVAVMALSVDIQLAGADDVIAVRLDMPVEYLLWVLRIGFFVFPVICFLVTRRVCLALQRADRRKLREGETFGIRRYRGARLRRAGLCAGEPAAAGGGPGARGGAAARRTAQADAAAPDPAAHSEPHQRAGAGQAQPFLRPYPPGEPRVTGAARRPACERPACERPAGGRERAGRPGRRRITCGCRAGRKAP